MCKELEQQLTDTLIKYRGIQSSIESLKTSISDVDNKIHILEDEQATLKFCKPVIDDIINKFSDSLLRKLEILLTTGLQKIFYDRNYSVQIKVVDKRNTKCVELLLNDNGNLIPVKNSNVAGGILVVIASIIQIFYIINLNVDKYIFLDEQLSQISKTYIQPFMEFIHALCEDTNLSVVLISHDDRFTPFCDYSYYVEHGKFTLKQDN